MIDREIRTHIQGRVHIASELKAKNFGQEAEKGTELIRNVNKVGVSPNEIYIKASFDRPLRHKQLGQVANKNNVIEDIFCGSVDAPLATSHTRTVSSKPPETSRFDLGLKFTQKTKFVWPFSVFTVSIFAQV